MIAAPQTGMYTDRWRQQDQMMPSKALDWAMGESALGFAGSCHAQCSGGAALSFVIVDLYPDVPTAMLARRSLARIKPRDVAGRLITNRHVL